MSKILPMLRWRYRATLDPRDVRVSTPMNEIAAAKRFGPLLLGPVLEGDREASNPNDEVKQ